MTVERGTPRGAGCPASGPGKEEAALYAAEALPPGEAREFEAHLLVCPVCRSQVIALREALAAVHLAEPGPTPPPALREALLRRVREEAAPGKARRGEASAPVPPAASDVQVWKRWRSEPPGGAVPGLHVVRAGEGAWEPTAEPGVLAKALSVDPARRSVTMLVRMEPGSSYPRHRHAGAEECYVLDGELRVGEEVLRAGDFQRAEEGSIHGVQSTESGCLLLIVSSQDDELV